jgi:hypothetical protein
VGVFFAEEGTKIYSLARDGFIYTWGRSDTQPSAEGECSLASRPRVMIPARRA